MPKSKKKGRSKTIFPGGVGRNLEKQEGNEEVVDENIPFPVALLPRIAVDERGNQMLNSNVFGHHVAFGGTQGLRGNDIVDSGPIELRLRPPRPVEPRMPLFNQWDIPLVAPGKTPLGNRAKAMIDQENLDRIKRGAKFRDELLDPTPDPRVFWRLTRPRTEFTVDDFVVKGKI